MKRLLLILLCLPSMGMAQEKEYEITVNTVQDSIAECSLKTKYITTEKITIEFAEAKSIFDKCFQDSVYIQSAINVLNNKYAQNNYDSLINAGNRSLAGEKVMKEVKILQEKMNGILSRKGQYSKILEVLE